MKKPFLYQSLQTAIGFKFQNFNIKNTNFYAEKNVDRNDMTLNEKSHLSINRISYKFYKQRYPEISN